MVMGTMVMVMLNRESDEKNLVFQVMHMRTMLNNDFLFS